MKLKAEAVRAIVEGLKKAGVNFITSVPCTAFREVIPAISNDPGFIHVPVANEADAVAICAGAWLGGKKPALLAENSGFLLATHAIAQSGRFGGFPLLLMLDHKGDFGEYEGAWYFGPGVVTPDFLDALRIPYVIVRESSKFAAELIRGQQTTESYGKPAAVLFSGEEAW